MKGFNRVVQCTADPKVEGGRAIEDVELTPIESNQLQALTLSAPPWRALRKMIALPLTSVVGQRQK